MSEASNENSEIVKMSRQAQPPLHPALMACLDAQDRAHFSELEAIYKPLTTAKADHSGPCGEGPGSPLESRRKRKKKRRENGDGGGGGGCAIGCLMAELFGKLVRRVVDHQESMHRRLADVLERMEEERAAREEEWRRREAERVEREAEARAKEKSLARDREAVIISFLERITGEKVGTCSGYEAVKTDGRDDP